MKMSIFYNSSNSFGIVIDAFTYNITGDLFLTLMAMIILLLAFCLMFKIPIEYSAIIILPILFTCMAYTSQFVAIGGLTLIYLGTLMFKYFFIK